jgi:hypothetical protein
MTTCWPTCVGAACYDDDTDGWVAALERCLSRWDEAAGLLRTVLATDPHNEEGLCLMALAQFGQAAYDLRRPVCLRAGTAAAWLSETSSSQSVDRQRSPLRGRRSGGSGRRRRLPESEFDRLRVCTRLLVTRQTDPMAADRVEFWNSRQGPPLCVVDRGTGSDTAHSPRSRCHY